MSSNEFANSVVNNVSSASSQCELAGPVIAKVTLTNNQWFDLNDIFSTQGHIVFGLPAGRTSTITTVATHPDRPYLRAFAHDPSNATFINYSREIPGENKKHEVEVKAIVNPSKIHEITEVNRNWLKICRLLELPITTVWDAIKEIAKGKGNKYTSKRTGIVAVKEYLSTSKKAETLKSVSVNINLGPGLKVTYSDEPSMVVATSLSASTFIFWKEAPLKYPISLMCGRPGIEVSSWYTNAISLLRKYDNNNNSEIYQMLVAITPIITLRNAELENPRNVKDLIMNLKKAIDPQRITKNAYLDDNTKPKAYLQQVLATMESYASDNTKNKIPALPSHSWSRNIYLDPRSYHNETLNRSRLVNRDIISATREEPRAKMIQVISLITRCTTYQVDGYTCDSYPLILRRMRHIGRNVSFQMDSEAFTALDTTYANGVNIPFLVHNMQNFGYKLKELKPELLTYGNESLITKGLAPLPVLLGKTTVYALNEIGPFLASQPESHFEDRASQLPIIEWNDSLDNKNKGAEIRDITSDSYAWRVVNNWMKDFKITNPYNGQQRSLTNNRPLITESANGYITNMFDLSPLFIKTTLVHTIPINFYAGDTYLHTPSSKLIKEWFANNGDITVLNQLSEQAVRVNNIVHEKNEAFQEYQEIIRNEISTFMRQLAKPSKGKRTLLNLAYDNNTKELKGVLPGSRWKLRMNLTNINMLNLSVTREQIGEVNLTYLPAIATYLGLTVNELKKAFVNLKWIEQVRTITTRVKAEALEYYTVNDLLKANLDQLLIQLTNIMINDILNSDGLPEILGNVKTYESMGLRAVFKKITIAPNHKTKIPTIEATPSPYYPELSRILLTYIEDLKNLLNEIPISRVDSRIFTDINLRAIIDSGEEVNTIKDRSGIYKYLDKIHSQIEDEIPSDEDIEKSLERKEQADWLEYDD